MYSQVSTKRVFQTLSPFSCLFWYADKPLAGNTQFDVFVTKFWQQDQVREVAEAANIFQKNHITVHSQISLASKKVNVSTINLQSNYTWNKCDYQHTGLVQWLIIKINDPALDIQCMTYGNGTKVNLTWLFWTFTWHLHALCSWLWPWAASACGSFMCLMLWKTPGFNC